ncbi:hydrogenase formation protein HypD [Sorangium sp. So ce1036]|uniref:hydrogenase formation protein HypD n=1 Tax=Sorangium sp. So ce1036 TaxID=3133328 RepID=UPI003EFE6107
MRYVDEFRDPARVRRVAEALDRAVTRPWTVMEVCGGQTHAIARYGLDALFPRGLSLVHGPGCPVCVTPLEVIEAARAIALTPGVILCAYGDMLRVPGARGDLLEARSRGADVRVVLSPLDAVRLAQASPDRHVVFFGVGFETTAPATAMAAELARRLDLGNFSLLAAHVRVPPAMALLLASPSCRVQGFLAAGHVCAVAGTGEYPAIAARFGVPIVVTGFEPLDILQGLWMLVRQLEEGRAEVENQYARSVPDEGNPAAREMVARVFEPADRPFRGLGVVPAGGLRIREAYARWDAERRFSLRLAPLDEPGRCRAAEVLQGLLEPTACPEFGRGCTPDRPLGAPMVSTEGACAAYFRYRRARRAPGEELP